MLASTTGDAARSRESSTFATHPLPSIADWLVGAVVAVIGLALIVGGTALTFVVDREAIADGITQGEMQSDFLTPEESVEVASAVSTWVGAGLLATGGLLVLAAIGFVVGQRRLRRRWEAGDSPGFFWSSAFVGAVVSAVLSFVPFSPVLGGATAGYLETPESGRSVGVGAFSGLLTVAPVMVIMVFVLVGLVLGMLAIGESGLATLLAAAIFVGLMVVATVGAGLGALGGYVGGRFADEDDPL